MCKSFLSFALLGVALSSAGLFIYSQNVSRTSLTPNRQVVFTNTAFSFNYHKVAKVLFATGIWKFDDINLSGIPHAVNINCIHSRGVCTKTVQYVNTKGNKDYIEVYSIDFKILSWNDETIVAQFNWVFKKDSNSTIVINLIDKTIRIASSKESPLKQTKIGSYTDSGVLVDGSNKTIYIKGELTWFSR